MSYRDEYDKYMASDKWAARKVSYYKSHPRICNACDSDQDIHLHHKTYDRMGCELNSDLVPLCQKCHSRVHDFHRGSKHDLTEATDLKIGDIRGEIAQKLAAARARQASRKNRRKRLTLRQAIDERPQTTRLKNSTPVLRKRSPKPQHKAGRSDPVNKALHRPAPAKRSITEYQQVGDKVWLHQVRRGERYVVSAADFETLRKSLKNRDNPVVHGHVLVISSKHSVDATESPDIASDLMFYAALWAQRIKRRGGGSNIITSIGESATQSVFHTHVHVVPRQPNDGLHLPWTGQAK